MPEWMNDSLLVGAILLFVIDKVITNLRQRGIDLNAWGKILDKLNAVDFHEWGKRDKTLYQWHDKEDKHGKIWYNRVLLDVIEKQMERQESADKERNQLLSKIATNQSNLLVAFEMLQKQLELMQRKSG